MGRGTIVPIELVDFPDEVERAIFVNFTHDSIPGWLLDLALLQYELVDTVRIVDGGKSFRLRVELDADQVASAILAWEERGVLVRINRRELAAWMHFFLQYYRDGMAPVDHIDVEIPADRSKGFPGTSLILKVPLARPLGTPQETREILELPPQRSPEGHD